MSCTPQAEIIARGVCVKNGKLLLCHTKGSSNTYLPGGHIDCYESARMSLRRETREELGRESTVGRFLGVVEHIYKRGGNPYCEVNLVFELKIKGIVASRNPASREGYIEFWWKSLKELDRSRLEPAVLRKALPSWLRQKRTGGWASTYERKNSLLNGRDSA